MNGKSRNGFNLDAVKRIKNPSSEFESFLENYFVSSMLVLRNELEYATFEKLIGDERAVAIELIAANLSTGSAHLSTAVAMYQIKELYAQLRDAFDKASSIDAKFVIGRALFMVDGISREDFYPVIEEIAEFSGNFYGTDAMRLAYALNDQNESKKLVKIGFHRDDYMIRCAAYDSLLALEYIKANGGLYTLDIGDRIHRDNMAWAIEGSTAENRFLTYNGILSDALFARSNDFDTALAPLLERLEAL